MRWMRSVLTVMVMCVVGSGLFAAQDSPKKNPLEGNSDAIRGGMGLLLRFMGISLRIDRKDFRGVVSLAFVSNALYPFLFVLGLSRTRAGNAALLMALTPVFAYLIGVFRKRESFNFAVLVGIVISLGGVLALVLFGSGEVSWGDTWIGDSLMISSAFCWAWYSAEQTRFLPKYGAIRLTVFTMLDGEEFRSP